MMNVCKNCGVELDDDMTFCPLCGLAAGEKPDPQEMSDSQEMSDPQEPVRKDKILRAIKNLTGKQKRKLFWQISGIILGSGIVVTLLINLVISNSFHWAKYVLVASLAAYAIISSLARWRRRPFFIILVSLVSLVLMLLFFDLFGVKSGWGIKLGIPILVSFYVLLLIVLLFIRLSNQLGFNVLAMLFIALGIFLLCVEFFSSLYFRGEVVLSWSIIAAVSMIPVAAVLFYVHFKLSKEIDLKRFFHI